jgi:hypothetical protein
MMYHNLGNLALGSCTMEEILNDGWNLRGKNYTMEEELHDGWKLRRKVEKIKVAKCIKN